MTPSDHVITRDPNVFAMVQTGILIFAKAEPNAPPYVPAPQKVTDVVVSVKAMKLHEEGDVVDFSLSDGTYHVVCTTEEERIFLSGLLKGQGIGEEVTLSFLERYLGLALYTVKKTSNVPECDMHGSIEHMQSITGMCPSCGNP